MSPAGSPLERGVAALFRLTLGVLPAELRRSHGDEMVETFRERQVRARRSGRRGRLARLWLEETVGLVVTAFRARFGRSSYPASSSDSRTGPGSQAPPRLPGEKGRRSRPMDGFVQDIRTGIRAFRERPGLTAVAILAMALGIGANTAIFSVVHGILGDLPYPDAERLVMLYEEMEGGRMSLAPAELLALEDDDEVLEDVAAYSNAQDIITGGPYPESVSAKNVTHDLLDLLGSPPALGRDFTEADIEAGQPLVLVGWELWQRRWGGDPDLVGGEIVVDGQARTVIGVTARDFRFFGDTDFLLHPLVFTPDEETSVTWHNFQVIGRYRQGLELAAVRERVAAVGERAQEQHDHRDEGERRLYPLPLHERVVGDVREPLLLLMGAVGLLLLIASSNVANLEIARGLARRREMAMRLALGADRGRLVRQLLTESGTLALVGAAAGLGLAWLSMAGLRGMLAEHLPRTESIGIDPLVLGFTLVLGLLAGILAGLAPAWVVSRRNLTESLKESSAAVAGSRSASWLRRGFLVVQVALALVLTVGAGLLARSFLHLGGVDLGFEPRNVVTTSLSLSGNPAYQEEPELRMQFFDRLLERLEGLPDIEGAAVTNLLPATGGAIYYPIEIPERPDEELNVGMHVATAGYFDTMQIPVVRGRAFTDRDGAEAAIVNRELARRYWPDGDVLGRQLEVGGREERATVIGVVGDVTMSVTDPVAEPIVYVPGRAYRPTYAYLLVRTDLDPRAAGERIRTAVTELEPDQPIGRVRALEEQVSDTFARHRLNTVLLGLFAAIALLLAAVGEYAVIQYVVRQRTGEIGIRMALGARGGDVLAMVLRQGLALALLGVGLGLAGAWAASRLLESMLHGVEPTDPLTYAAVAGFLTLVAVTACLLPARAATRVDPVRALRDS